MTETKPSRISASQIGTYEDCSRYWWFQRILRLQEPPATHFTFGTVLHSCNERYLSADKNQRVPAGITDKEHPLFGQTVGQPVNLFPKGWKEVTERDGTKASVTEPEARLIQKLVQESIDSGVLRWRADTQVERELLLPVIEGVQLIGYVDAFKPNNHVQELPLIEDHKSYGKGSLRFLKRADEKSPNYLGKDQQLKTYCWAVSELDGWAGDVTVRHNQYPKFDGKEVTSVETVITRAQIVAHGEYLRDVAERIERTRKIKDWGDVPGPKDTGKCSRWYGKPCTFSEICGRAETPDAYKARLDRLRSGGSSPRLNLPLAQPKKRTKTKNSMSIFDRAKAQKTARSDRQDKAQSTQAKAQADAPSMNGAEPAPETSVQGGAPWANPGCKACKGRGLTSKNKACPICDTFAKKAGRPTSMYYVLEITEEGLGVAVVRDNHEQAVEASHYPSEWYEGAEEPEAVEEPTTHVEEPAPVEVSEPTPRPAPVEEPEPKTRAKARTKGAGRKTVGLTIMVGCTILRGMSSGRTVITSSEVLARFGAELAEDMGSMSYWELDSFKRRERLAQKADYIATELSKHILIHPGILGNDDEGKLVQALMGLPEGIDAVIARIS